VNLLLIAGVIASVPHPLVLSTCYADAARAWRGPRLNESGIEDMISTFSLDADGPPVGGEQLQGFSCANSTDMLQSPLARLYRSG
jgi:hypothetical protein